MGMTIETAIRLLRGTYNSYNDVNAAAYVGLCKEENDALKIALETMRKYQQIVQIYQNWNEVNDFSYNQAMQKIGEVIEDGKID